MSTRFWHASSEYCGFRLDLTIEWSELDQDRIPQQLLVLLDTVAEDLCCKEGQAIRWIEDFILLNCPTRAYEIRTTYEKKGLCVKSSPKAT